VLSLGYASPTTLFIEPQPRCIVSEERLRRRVRSCRALSPCAVSLI
jgi:hypothetical protein